MRVTTTAVALVLLAVPTLADEPPAPPEAVEEAVSKVLAAIDAEDGEALESLARVDRPDPWRVADALCARGRREAALAFARAAPRKCTEKLPAYVEAWTARRPAGDPGAAIGAALVALGKKDGKAVLAALEGVSAEPPDVTSAVVLLLRGIGQSRLKKRDESRRTALAAADLAERIGWLRLAAQACQSAGLGAWYGRNYAAAAEAWDRAHAIEEALGDPRRANATLLNLAIVYGLAGEQEKSYDAYQRGLEVAKRLGHLAGMAQALTGIGGIQQNRCEYVEALRTEHKALRAARQAGDRRREAMILNHIGRLHDLLGNTEQAWRALSVALRYFARTNDRIRLAAVMTDFGNQHRHRGDYGSALTCHQQALELQEELGDERGMAVALTNLGALYELLGDTHRALGLHERALALQEKAGAGSLILITLRNLGALHTKRGEYDRALALIERAVAFSREREDRPGLASALSALGSLRRSQGQYDEALAAYGQALEIREGLGNRVDVADILRRMGTVHWKRGDREKALEEMERARALAARCGAVASEIFCLWSLARWRRELGEPAEAVRLAREGVENLPRVLGRLGEERAAEFRGRWAGLVELGVRAGREIGDVSVVAYFLESGRAGALLESLGGHDALAGVSLPKELRQLETDARARVFEARARLDRATRLGERKEIQAAREALDAAEEGFLTVVARLRRTAKQEAAVTYPSAAPLDEIRACLRDGEALVLYAFVGEEAAALVVTPKEARTVSLGSTAEIEAAAADFSPSATEGELGPRIEKLRAKLIAPLGLDEGTKRLLVSPDGRLAYVPFALLADDREVAYVPSGTTLALLRREGQDRAEGVLALGDPEYGSAPGAGPVAVLRSGFDLVRLPATREEAKEIGDTVLLGSEATEAGFARTVASRPRWRAVHFACHGLLDPDRPTLSALALAKDAANDGFLTCLEVIRSRIPADLVALSACETARGKAYRAEGIVGLTRAFMVAGSPRILCSLWKVDDAATRALMGRFYELWNPEEGEGLPAATALRRAQESVRSREEWRHPRYWAAWVLWGRPE